VIRVDYERMTNKPGFCRILIWEQADSGVIDANPQKQIYEEDVPEDQVLRRVTDLSNQLNKTN
jgi:hypothetical protein